MKMVSLAQKLSMIKEWHQEKSVSFKEEISETKVTDKKNNMGSTHGEDDFYSSENNHDGRMVPRKNFIHFSDKNTGSKVKPELSWVRVPIRKLSLGMSSYSMQ
jgi:hypothetical protein